MQRIFVKMWYAVNGWDVKLKLWRVRGKNISRILHSLQGGRFLNSIQYISNTVFSKIYNDSKIVVEQRDFVPIIF